MAKCTVIPFGPQHPVLPEPLQLDLVLDDETVVEAIPSIGFVHRGLEKLVEIKDFSEMVYVAERVCGICSFIHGMTYCIAIEGMMNIAVPPRANYLRVFWSELSRIHSHLLWLGLMADAIGFESLFMHSWRIRDKVLDMIEETTGGRVIFGSSKIGGVRRDVAREKLYEIAKRLDVQAGEMKEVGGVFIEDISVKHRLVGTGVLSKDDAYHLGAVGPTARGSGVAMDTRQIGYGAYGDFSIEPQVETAGDCYARCVVRIRELFQSVDIIHRVVEKIPDGPIDAKAGGFPNGEFFARTEQPRGEVVYHVKANGTKMLKRLRIRTPTFANIPVLLKMLAGCQLADVPVIVLTIDPCIGCSER